jgi:hypothetical protein
MRPWSIVLDLQAICILPGTSYSVHPPVLVTIFGNGAVWTEAVQTKFRLLYGNPEDYKNSVLCQIWLPNIPRQSGSRSHRTHNRWRSADGTVEVLDRGGVHASSTTLPCGTAASYEHRYFVRTG